jgi:tetratricopeptide (TPR) repeat protein
VLCTAAILLVALVYASAPAGGFVWDDHHLIEDQPGVHEIRAPWVYLGWQFWNQPEQLSADTYYRPLVVLSYALDWQLWGGHPAGFHATNVVLHLICVGLLFALARRSGAPPLAAGLAALLFGTLPRLTESVAWIAGRTDPLASALVLGALLAHRSEPRAHAARIGAAALLFAGLLAKEVAVAGAVALIALEVVRTHELGARRLAVQLAPLAVALALYAGLRMAALPGGSQGDLLTIGERVAFGLQALGTYAGMLLDPLRPRLRIGMLGVYEPLHLALGALGLVGAAWSFLRAPWGVRIPLLLALAALLPVLHLVALPMTVVAADRFLYLPVAGLALAAAVASAQLSGDAARGAVALAIGAFLVFGFATQRRIVDWHDELALLELGAARAPFGDGGPHASLGTAHLRERRFEAALRHYRKSHQIELAFAKQHPRFRPNPSVVGSMAICEASLGRYDVAAGRFEELVQLEPEVPVHHYNLAVTYGRGGRLHDARAALERALALYPDYPEARALYERLRGS